MRNDQMRTMLLATGAALLLAAPAAASPAPESGPAHEAAEDVKRTVPGAPSKGVKACHDDIERFCSKVEPGEGRIGRCLQKRRAKLSKACRAFLFHGGKTHVQKAFLEIDSYVIGASTPAAPAPAPKTAPDSR